MSIGHDATELWLLADTDSPRRSRLAGALLLSFAVHAGLSGPLLHFLRQAPVQPVELVLTIHLSTAEQETAERTANTHPPERPNPPVPTTAKMPLQPVSVSVPQPRPQPPIKPVTVAAPKAKPQVTPLPEETVTVSPVTSASPPAPVVPSVGQVATDSPVAVPARRAPSIRPVYSPQPVYPRLALRLGLEGQVMLRVWVSAEGVPGAIVVTKSSGYESLDASARQGVQQWRFEIQGDTQGAVGGWVNLPVTFRLE